MKCRKVGDIIPINGEWYQCVEGRCKDCHFSEKRFLCKQFIIKDFCTHGIIFKKLEKVGEPFTGKVHIQLQRYNIYTKPIIDSAENVGYIDEGNTIAIEIKQTKEDMEEKKVKLKKEDIDFLYNKFIEIIEECVVKGYNIDNVQHEFGKLFLRIKDSDTKLNLKPFDLEAAKAGKPVCTRNGRKARIICFDLKNGEYPIVAAIGNDSSETLLNYTINGEIVKGNYKSGKDLMMLPEKKEGWVNIVRGSDGRPYMGRGIFQSKEEAENAIKAFSDNLIDTVKISWEE